MCAARIVADHSADGAAIVRRWVWREGELMGLGPVAQGVQNNARLNACESLLGIELENLVHVLGEIQDDGDVAALSRQAGPRSPRQDRSVEFSARRHRGNHIF